MRDAAARERLEGLLEPASETAARHEQMERQALKLRRRFEEELRRGRDVAATRLQERDALKSTQAEAEAAAAEAEAQLAAERAARADAEKQAEQYATGFYSLGF